MNPGTTTLPMAMAAPMTTVPAKSAGMGGAERSRMPPMRTTKRPTRTASIPKRRTSVGAKGETNPKQMTGMVVSMPATVPLMPVASMICSSTGETASRGARKLSPTMRMVTIRKSMGMVPRRARIVVDIGDRSCQGR